jgi:hypothetical protein
MNGMRVKWTDEEQGLVFLLLMLYDLRVLDSRRIRISDWNVIEYVKRMLGDE